MKDSIKARIKRLEERKTKTTVANDALEDELRRRSEEQLVRLLTGSPILPTGMGLKRARELAREIKRDV